MVLGYDRVANTRGWLLGGILYSGGPHIRFLCFGEGSLWILGFGVPSRPNPFSGALKSTLPGPGEGSSILNVHLVVMSAAVSANFPHRLLGGILYLKLAFCPGHPNQ